MDSQRLPEMGGPALLPGEALQVRAECSVCRRFGAVEHHPEKKGLHREPCSPPGTPVSLDELTLALHVTKSFVGCSEGAVRPRWFVLR